MAAQVPDDTLIISIERDSDSADIAHAIHKHASVGNRIQILVGSTGSVIPQLHRYCSVQSFDFIFIDHNGSHYLRDFKLLEELGFIKSGTMIVADNVITPGAPDYMHYLHNNPNYKTKTYESNIEYSNDIRDAVAVSVRN